MPTDYRCVLANLAEEYNAEPDYSADEFPDGDSDAATERDLAYFDRLIKLAQQALKELGRED